MPAESELLPLEPLMQQWPGREDQIHKLAGLIGEVGFSAPLYEPLFFV